MLPEGWTVVAKGDIFDTHILRGPNGFSAVVSKYDNNLGCILYMLVKALLEEKTCH